MTFYLIGLGLNLKSISVEALGVLKECKKVYLENYTVNFPYDVEELTEIAGKDIIKLEREPVESESFLEEARKQDIALLVYGSPLAATTHMSLILKCRKEGINHKILHNASVINAVSETGLQMYKFGKTASMPAWNPDYQPDSFAGIIKDNLKIRAHTLLLVDIGLKLEKAREELRVAAINRKIRLEKVILCSAIGTEKQKIFYDKLDNLPEKVDFPFCFIIPSSLHFLEEEALKNLEK
jgi:diphthine synthase